MKLPDVNDIEDSHVIQNDVDLPVCEQEHMFIPIYQFLFHIYRTFST